jgi:hypothetical protein
MNMRCPLRCWRPARRALAGCVIALGAGLAAGGCATGHSATGGSQVSTVVHLTNDLAPPADVSVYAVTQDGIRTLIGTVPPSGHRVLRVPQSMLPGTSFRIIAERPLARAIVSQPITASTSDTIIDWELQSNSMWFPEGEGS